MSEGRLAYALRTGSVHVPDAGRIAVLSPPEGFDVSPLPRERVTVVQGFRPAYDAFAALGYEVAVTVPEDVALAIMVVPRAKAEAQALIRMAAMGGRPVIVDGLNDHGVGGLMRELRRRAEVSPAVSKAHGKIFTVTAAPGAFDDWARAPSHGDWMTAPGVFSADGPDPGSAALAAALPCRLEGRVVDLGAGWGYLAARALDGRPDIVSLDLVEADHAAVEASRENVTDPRAQFHWADARVWGAAQSADHVLCNPPFHISRVAAPELGRAFIAAAARLLTSRGTLWLVANRHLPYEATLGEQFQDCSALPGPDAYKLFRCTGPKSARSTQRRARQRRP